MHSRHWGILHCVPWFLVVNQGNFDSVITRHWFIEYWVISSRFVCNINSSEYMLNIVSLERSHRACSSWAQHGDSKVKTIIIIYYFRWFSIQRNPPFRIFIILFVEIKTQQHFKKKTIKWVELFLFDLQEKTKTINMCFAKTLDLSALWIVGEETFYHSFKIIIINPQKGFSFRLPFLNVFNNY